MTLLVSPRITPPEDNVTGQDYTDRRHFCYRGPPLIDIHAHVTTTRADHARGWWKFLHRYLSITPPASCRQADIMLAAARDFGIVRSFTMCPPEDIPALRRRFGQQLGFNGHITKKTAEEPDETALRLLESYLEQGVQIIKFWAAPRGRDRGLLLDTPWRIEAARRALAAGIRVFMVHVADPDHWFRTVYSDTARYGTKPDQYLGLERLLQMFPEAAWIGAHLGGDPEHPDHLEALLERYPNLYLDTSATKWVVREIATRREAIHALICRFPQRFLFGVDLVTRHHLKPEHYASRYWCQRTLWESDWEGPSPIADADYTLGPGGPATPWLRGLALPANVLEQVYQGNARRLLG
jgi:predicted TIM-barrel fold metal-dependent hydrolase